MAFFMNQILAYGISAEVKCSFSKETFTKKRKPQIEVHYVDLAKMDQSTFRKRKKYPQNFCLLAFKETQSEFFQGINQYTKYFYYY